MPGSATIRIPRTLGSERHRGGRLLVEQQTRNLQVRTRRFRSAERPKILWDLEDLLARTHPLRFWAETQCGGAKYYGSSGRGYQLDLVPVVVVMVMAVGAATNVAIPLFETKNPTQTTIKNPLVSPKKSVFRLFIRRTRLLIR